MKTPHYFICLFWLVCSVVLIPVNVNAQGPLLRPVASLSNGAGSTGALLSFPNSVFVNGNYAYVASTGNNALEIIDISTPSTPVHLSSIVHNDHGAQLNSPLEVYVAGNYAYVLGSKSLEVIDISNPVHPVHAGALFDGQGGANMKSPRGISIVGNYAYVLNTFFNSIEIVDISIPTHPVHVTTLGNGDNGASIIAPNSITVSGHYALIGGYGPIEVLDISDPGHPLHKTTFLNDGTSKTVFASGGYAYVSTFADGLSSHTYLTVVDISNPELPVTKGHYDGGMSFGFPPFNGPAIAVSGSTVYLTSPAGNKLVVINASDPNNPTLDQSMTISGEFPTSMVFHNGFAFLTKRNSLEVIDVGSLGAPSQVGSLNNSLNGAILEWPTSISVEGIHAYLVGGNALEIVDVSDPSSPRHAGSLVDGEGGAKLKSATSVYAAGNRAYITTYWDTFEIVDVSDKSNPIHLGSLSNGEGGAKLLRPYHVLVSGNIAYITSDIGLEIVNVEDASHPAHLSSFVDGDDGGSIASPTSLFKKDNLIYITNGNGYSIEVIDVSDPSHPSHRGIFQATPGQYLHQPMSIFVQDNFAYVVNWGSTSLEIFDVSNLSDIKYKGKLVDGTDGAILNQPYSVVVSGQYAFIGGDFGLEMVDVSNPELPRHMGSLVNGSAGVLLGGARSIVNSGSYLFASSTSNAMIVVQFDENGKLDQAITFERITDRVMGDSGFQLEVAASSGLPVSIDGCSLIEIHENSVVIVAPGRVEISASQAGNDDFYPAPAIVQSFCIDPAKPVITSTPLVSGSITLSSSASTGNQWYLNDEPITGALDQQLIVQSEGSYSVKVTIDDCDSEPSAVYPFVIAGDLNAQQLPVRLFPNPTHDLLHVSGSFDQDTELKVIDALGRMAQVEWDQQPQLLTVRVSNLSSGIYVLNITSAGKAKQLKFVKH